MIDKERVEDILLANAKWKRQRIGPMPYTVLEVELAAALQIAPSANMEELPMRWRDTHTLVPCDGDDVIGYWTPDSNFGRRACQIVHYFAGKWCEPGQPHLGCGAPDLWMLLPPLPTA